MDAVKKKQKAVTFGQFEDKLKYTNAVDAGFVYRITFRIGTWIFNYVGQKHYLKWNASSRKWVTTNWHTYTSSSKSVNALLKYAVDVQYSIIGECMTSNGLYKMEYAEIEREWKINARHNINLQVGNNLRRPDYFETQKAINVTLDACIRRANYITVIAEENK